MRVFISGQKYFGEQVLRLCIQKGFTIAGVCCPLDDQYIGKLAQTYGLPIIAAGTLCADTLPEAVDLGIVAHSFDYIGKATRYKTRLGWLGYHPSLLPRHRGRSAIDWAIRMKDIVTGGTVFWLNSGIDRGDIERQQWIWLDHTQPARLIWREQLLPLGVQLLSKALDDIAVGKINKTPQDSRYSTFEPCTDVKDIYKPDLLMLPAHRSA